VVNERLRSFGVPAPGAAVFMINSLYGGPESGVEP
jgi:hypothetical protein